MPAAPPRKLEPAEEVALQQAGQYAGRRDQDILTPANAATVGLDPERGYVARGVPDSEPQIPAPPEVLASRTDPMSGAVIGPSTLQPGDTREKPSPVAPISNLIDAALGQPGRLEATMKKLQPGGGQPEQNGQSKPEDLGLIPDREHAETEAKKPEKPEDLGLIPDSKHEQPKPQKPEDLGLIPDSERQPQPATPMPSGTGAGAPQGTPAAPPPLPQPQLPPEAQTEGYGASAGVTADASDPSSRISHLISQGLDPGYAQAVVAGQLPKTISGNLQAPPKLKPPPEVAAPEQPAALPTPSASDEAIRARNEQALAHPPAPSKTSEQPTQPRTPPPLTETQKAITTEFGWIDRAAVAAHPEQYPSGNKGFPDFGTVDLSGEHQKGVSLPPEDINARLGRNVMTRDAKGVWHADPEFAADVRSGRIQVEVTNPETNKTAMAPLVDIGPDKARTGAGLDVLHGTALDVGFTSGKGTLHYRIAGAGPATGAQQPKSIADAAVSNVGQLNTTQDPGTNGGELACADAVSRIVRGQMGIDLPRTLSTADMYDSLRKDWKEVPPNTPGAIIISPTTGDRHGHVGIVGPDGKTVYSNSSRTGNWVPNYTTDSWAKYFGGKGFEVHAFVPGPNVGHLTAEQLAAERAKGDSGDGDGKRGGGPSGGPTPSSIFAGQPMIGLDVASSGGPQVSKAVPSGSSGGGGGDDGGSQPARQVDVGTIGFYPSGGSQQAQQQPTQQQPKKKGPPPEEEPELDPMVTALMKRGFTQQQAINYAQGVQNIVPGKGIEPLKIPGPPPQAPAAPPALPGKSGITLSLTGKQPVTPRILSAKELMPSKVAKLGPPPAAPSAGPDPSVIKGLMKQGFTREQAMAVASKATVSKPGAPVTTGSAIFRPPPAAPSAPAAPPVTPAQHAPARQPTQAQAAPPPPPPPSDQPKPRPQPQAETEPTEFTGRPPGSTHGNPTPPGHEAISQWPRLAQQAKQHASILSADDPRVKKQPDGYIKGEHFVEGDPFHENVLSGLPYGKQGRQRQIMGHTEQAIADKSPMHISYISAPQEAEKFPTRESRKVQYDESSPEARLMGTTEGQLVGHSLIPLSVGVKLSSKGSEPHQSYIQGLSTNIMANNFQHINDKLAAMGRKTPYKELGAKFANDLEGYFHNLNAGHTATGRGYAVGTEDHPNEPDREHVPYKLSRKEADFIGAVINNDSAFAQHEDAKKLRELARANGTLITEKGETNRLRHDIEQHEPGWRKRMLEPSIRTFKTGLVHEVHPSEEHMPETIRPGKGYQALTKSLARTSERGRPDVPIGASLHHTFQDNAAINKIERDFSEHKIDEATAREQIKALGEDPEDYRFVGGSGGLITPYEDDPEAITPEEHTQMRDNLRQQWVGGKLGVDDYRKKAAEVPLPSKPSKPKAVQPVETPEAPPAPKPLAPKPPKPPKPQAPPTPEPESIEAPEQHVFRKAGNEAGEPDAINSLKREGHFYRGMTKDEHDATVGAGKGIQSSQEYSTPGEGTSLSEHPDDAESYVNYGRDDPRKTGKPNYLVEAKGGDNIKYDKRDGYHKAAAGVPHEQITRTWEMKGDDKGQVVATPHPIGQTSEAPAPKPKKAPAIAPAPDEPLPEEEAKPVKSIDIAPGPGEPLPKVKAVKPAAVSPPVAAPTKPGKLPKLVKPKDANKEWKGVPEADKQTYLEEKVRRTLASQIRDKATHELKVQRNEDGSVQYYPNGSPVYEQHDYDIVNSPMLKKKAINQIKNADKHEDTLGNLIGPDGKEVIDPETGKAVLKHKTLNQTERRRLSAMHTASAIHTMGDKIFDSYKEAIKNPDIAAGEGWYSRMRKRLADALGEHHELFAQLLGATSAKTPVRTNFINALDAFEQYREGKFKNHIEKFLEAHGKLREGEGALTQHMRDQGILKAHEADHESDADAMAHWIKHHDILPISKKGSKYSANSNAVLKVLAGTWLKEVGAPKTPNFAGNLTGRTLEATIDVWAARHLQRLGYEGHMKGPWRAQSAAEPTVSNMDFAFSQDAMRHAAERISKETGKQMNPDDLQAILWFAEKHHYEDRGWTRGQGAEKSSFDDVADRVFGKDGQPHDRPMDSTQLRAHYQAEGKALRQRKDKIETAQSYLGTPHEQTKLPGYMAKHGLTHEEVHGGAQDEEEEAA